jgi:DNA-binding FrmR family transcriptional regulator
MVPGESPPGPTARANGNNSRSGGQNTAEAMIARLRKVEGQVRGIQRMVEAGRPCEDILTQVSAVVNALRRVGALALGCAITEAVREALREGRDPAEETEELAGALARLS